MQQGWRGVVGVKSEGIVTIAILVRDLHRHSLPLPLPPPPLRPRHSGRALPPAQLPDLPLRMRKHLAHLAQRGTLALPAPLAACLYSVC